MKKPLQSSSIIVPTPTPTPTHEHEHEPCSRRRTLWLCVGLMLCLLLGCREHPRVTSRESLDFIKQVYTACNTRNQERLAVCRQRLDELAAAGELSEAEQESFRSIISSAESGDWESAQRSSLQFARDQMR